MTSFGALIAIAVFAALVVVWAFALARISARSDRRIEHMNLPHATDGNPAAAGSPASPSGLPAPRAPVAAPMTHYTRERR